MTTDSARQLLAPALEHDAAPRFIENFVQALQYRNISLAASNIGIRYCTLWWQIRQLEKYFGDPLIYRSRTSSLPMSPTPKGVQVVAAARAIGLIPEGTYLEGH